MERAKRIERWSKQVEDGIAFSDAVQSNTWLFELFCKSFQEVCLTRNYSHVSGNLITKPFELLENVDLDRSQALDSYSYPKPLGSVHVTMSKLQVLVHPSTCIPRL